MARIKYKQLCKELEHRIDHLNQLLQQKESTIKNKTDQINFLIRHNEDLKKLMSLIEGCSIRTNEDIQYNKFQTLACTNVQRYMTGKKTILNLEFVVRGNPSHD